ncbi:MAG: DUF3298 and DUF4163 domain-containing protein [Firmicutes bacterium]|nr:DUF3298 and DUF4163 domain-containing protein [Bacillota bacterium]MCM1401637.1 DUF3298 and DUF4163 domain-containing protein [Bacteroides sp.]MCM1477523.1 DUF3298 and DUF4163 domain-containing protein [Bacteroides sp.]
MKLTKTLTIVLGILLLGASSAFDADAKVTRKSGRAKTRTTATAALTVKKGAVKNYADGLQTQEFSIKRGKSDILVEYPIAGNTQLVSAMRNWIKDMVCENYTGSLDTPDAMMTKAIKAVERGETLNEEVKVSYINDKVITVQLQSYLYMGGAHGMPGDVSRTFLLSNGTALTNEMLPSDSQLRSLIASGLCQYFEVANTSELADCMMCPVNELTKGVPYITDKGLVFKYGPYEIAPYAAGMPEAVIPVNKIKPLLGSTAAKFF